jgi:hypothetical protein
MPFADDFGGSLAAAFEPWLIRRVSVPENTSRPIDHAKLSSVDVAIAVAGSLFGVTLGHLLAHWGKRSGEVRRLIEAAIAAVVGVLVSSNIAPGAYVDGVRDDAYSEKIRGQMIDRFHDSILEARAALIAVSPIVPEAAGLATEVVGLQNPERNREAVAMLRSKLR